MKVKDWLHPNDQVCKLGRHSWSVPRLFELARDLPVMDVPLKHLNAYYLYERLTLRDMVMHMRAVNAADLNFFLYHSDPVDVPTPITGFTVQALGATQRRRMR